MHISRQLLAELSKATIIQKSITKKGIGKKGVIVQTLTKSFRAHKILEFGAFLRRHRQLS